MTFNTTAIQKNVGQKLADISLAQGKSNELWSELDETSQAAVSGGSRRSSRTTIINSLFSGNDGSL